MQLMNAKKIRIEPAEKDTRQNGNHEASKSDQQQGK
jgi:hypothetical protein